MTFTLIISLITIIGIITSLIIKPNVTIKGKSFGLYWIIALCGGILLIVTSQITINETFYGLTKNTAINPLKLLVIFFGMTIISVFLDEMNFFEYLASYAVKRSKSTQESLFFMLYVTVSILTAFTSNDVVILTFTPFILHFAKKVNINPIPYLVGEFVAANTLSMTLIIGNPTNIYLAAGAGIEFFEYFKVMLLPSIASSVGAYFILRTMFKKRFKAPLYVIDDEVKVGDKFLLIVGIVHLALAIVTLSVCSYANIQMWQACVIFVVSLFVITFIYSVIKKRGFKTYLNILKRLPFALIPFVISMFVIVLALNKCGFTEEVSKLFIGGDSIYVYGFASFLSANVFNNIPMSVLFSDVLALSTLSGEAKLGALFASVIGSNIGAYLTPVGALAGIMWLSILKRNGQNLSFARFMKYGILVAIPTMLIALIALHLSLLII